MNDLARLAFVDLETTGLRPEVDRITEIAIITVDRAGVEEWTALVNPGRRLRESVALPGVDSELLAAAPSFRDLANEVTSRLAGRLFIAHNARFDHGFLKAEFRRLGVVFEPRVLCSVMLSRRLYPHARGHDLDTLIGRHGLTMAVRHRAMPDARALRQFWRILQREHTKKRLASHVRSLLAGPVLPAHLDPALIDRLPEAPGLYVLHGEGRALHVGTAHNLRREVLNYFRLDHASSRALEVSHLVSDITWRTTRGKFGAQLQRENLESALLPARRRGSRGWWSWHVAPEATPALEIIALSERADAGESYGLFETERKAGNALMRLATRHGLCHRLLGIAGRQGRECMGCYESHGVCERRFARLQHLARACTALAPLRVRAWPYRGPIGIRERGEIHVIENWRYLGTARDEREIHTVVQMRASAFDRRVFRLLTNRLSRISAKRILELDTFVQPRGRRADVAEA